MKCNQPVFCCDCNFHTATENLFVCFSTTLDESELKFSIYLLQQFSTIGHSTLMCHIRLTDLLREFGESLAEQLGDLSTLPEAWSVKKQMVCLDYVSALSVCSEMKKIEIC